MPIADGQNGRQSFILPPIEQERLVKYEKQEPVNYSSVPANQSHPSPVQTSSANMNAVSPAHHHHPHTSHRYQPYHYSPQTSTRLPPQQRHHHNMSQSSPPSSTTTTTTTITNIAPSSASGLQNGEFKAGEEREFTSSRQPPPPLPPPTTTTTTATWPHLPSIKEALNHSPTISQQQQQQQQSQPTQSPTPSRRTDRYDSQPTETSYPPRPRSPYTRHLQPLSPRMDAQYNHKPSSTRTVNGTVPSLASLVHPPPPSLETPIHQQTSPAQYHSQPPPPRSSDHSSWSQTRASTISDDWESSAQPNGATSRHGTTPALLTSSSSLSSSSVSAVRPSATAEQLPPLNDHHYRQYPDPASNARGWRPEDREHPEAYSSHYGESIKRRLDIFDLENSLNEIADSSRELLTFTSHYSQKAHETQRTGPVPGSRPHLDEIDAMMKHSTRVQDSLHRMRAVVVTQEAALIERSREEAQRIPQQSGDTAGQHHAYYEDARVGGFAGADPKKRRGRAAPPGRCHSCNRAETPEWRRGPDGARTLCNACGLHYAKLTRKMGEKNAPAKRTSSNLRPKGEGDNASKETISAPAVTG